MNRAATVARTYCHWIREYRSRSRSDKYMSGLRSVRGTEGVVVGGEGVVIHSAIPDSAAVEGRTRLIGTGTTSRE